MSCSRAWVAALSLLLAAAAAQAQTVRFDDERAGAVPQGWRCGVTGGGQARWQVEADTGAPSAPQVLVQSGAADFAWCVRADSAFADGFVEVKLRPMRGREDQAGGVVWRWKDANTYYVARANALENNVALYRTEGGTRKTLKYVDAPVPAGAWHLLRVEFKGTRIDVRLNGKSVIAFEDTGLVGAGAVGVWTKADSVTAFDDFNAGAAAKP
jgi:hypothetical protein